MVTILKTEKALVLRCKPEAPVIAKQAHENPAYVVTILESPILDPAADAPSERNLFRIPDGKSRVSYRFEFRDATTATKERATN